MRVGLRDGIWNANAVLTAGLAAHGFAYNQSAFATQHMTNAIAD